MTKDHEQKHRDSENNRVVVAYVAGSTAEALVIRGLLESNGIKSPEPTTTDPFPLNEPPEGTHGPEIYTLEPQAEEARRIIDAYRRSASAAASK
jgi:hypothetical protein